MKRAVSILLFLLLTLSFAAMAASEAEFTAPAIVPAESIDSFIGEWFMFRIQASSEDGLTLSQEDLKTFGLVDDEPNIIITESEWKSRTEGVYEAGKHEFLPEDGTIKFIYETGEETVFFLNDNGMMSCLSYSGEKEATIYFVRVE